MTPPGVCFFPHRALRETLRIPRPQKGELKSPIFSPDLEKGRGVLDFPLFVRVRPLKIPISASPSKPRLRPKSAISSRNPARQKIDQGEGGSCTAHFATQKLSRVSLQACQLERGPVLLSPLLPNTRRTRAFRELQS